MKSKAEKMLNPDDDYHEIRSRDERMKMVDVDKLPREKKKNMPFDRVGMFLRGYELTGDRLCRVLGYSANTCRKKLKDPSYLTLGDLWKIYRIGRIPVEEIKNALNFL